MPTLLLGLSEAERNRLDETLPYVNMSELRKVCRKFDVPWAIYVELPDGGRRRTKDTDRKLVVLQRLRRHLETGAEQSPTVYPASVLPSSPLPNRPTPEDRLFYGHYNKHHEGMLALLGELTSGKFRNGAVARLVCRDYWGRGETPTFRQFARAWTEADSRGLGIERGEHPELAYLTDRAKGPSDPNWKAKRVAYASEALAILSKL